MTIELLTKVQLKIEAERKARRDAADQRREEAEVFAAAGPGCDSCRRVPGYRTSQLWERCDCCGQEPIYVE